MKQFQFGYTTPSDLRDRLAGIREACGQNTGRAVSFYITWAENSPEGLSDVTGALDEMFPEACYYGNEASGNIAEGSFSLGIHITCTLLEGEDSRAELVWVEEGTPISSLEDLWAYCERKDGLRGVEMIPSMSYVETLKIDRNVPPLSDEILIFGGASVNYDNPTYDAEILAKGHPRTRDGMAVLLYFGKSLAFSADSVLGWKGLGRLMEVTDSTGKCIREIDGNPAYSVYEKYLNLTMDDRDTLVFPLIAEEEGTEYIRTPQTVLPDRSMMMFADIPEGTRVRIAYGDKNTILRSVWDKAEAIAAFRPEGIRVYSCAARRLFWGDAEVSRETLPLQEIAPVCGFYTGGEILRFGRSLRVMNSTLAIVSLREGEGNQKPRTESAYRSEDKSLISRLTYFSEKIVEEEKAQRLLVEGFEKILSAEYQVMYYIDLVQGKATFLHGDEDAKKFTPIFNTSSVDAMFANFGRMYVDRVVAEEDREKVLAVMNTENVLRVLKTSNSISVNYRVRRNLVDAVYTEMRIFKASEDHGELTAVLLAFKMTDEELRTALEIQAKLKEDAQIIGALTEDFGCVYYVALSEDRTEDTVTEVRTSGRLMRLIPDWREARHFSTQLDLMRECLVYEPDREQFRADTRREVIMEELNASGICFINVRFLIDGELRYYQIQISAVHEKEKVTGFVAGLRSIDEQMKKEIVTQKKLEEALRAAEAANLSKSNFLFNMSHDIRTPMNAIKGYTAMGKKYAGNEKKVRDCLEKIDISGSQMITLINQVLEMSRIESGRIDLNLNPVDIPERFNAMITVMEAQAIQKSLQFNAVLENISHPRVLADDSRMGQITLNVVGNAIKYTPEGGRVDLTLREIPARKEGCGSYLFTVQDTGIGMSPAFLKRMYEPFARENTTTVSRIQGTGLGMSIVRNLVDLMDGTIEVQSEPGKGTRFDITVDFPLDGQETAAGAVPSVTVSAESFRGRHVLLVEDNEMNREIARDLLEDYGFIVEEANDGDVAFCTCVQRSEGGEPPFDLILMDIQMPRMNGYEATRAIRGIQDAAFSRVPIIAMTANAFEEDRQNALAAGMDEHLAKPIEIEKLLAAIAKFL